MVLTLFIVVECSFKKLNIKAMNLLFVQFFPF